MSEARDECDEVCTSSCHASDCEHHGYRAALASPSLDQERLARALVRWGGALHDVGVVTLDDEGRTAARAIAGEYDRLTTEER